MTLLSLALASALSAAPVPLPSGLEAGAVVLVDADAPPSRVTLEPDGLALRSRWYRDAGKTVVLFVLPRRSDERSEIALTDSSGGLLAASFGAATPLTLLPQLQAVAGRLLAFEIPPRESDRVILLEGEFEGALAMMEGVRIPLPLRGIRRRAIATLKPGPAALLFVYRPEPGAELVMREVSLHAGLPLPDPDEWEAATLPRSLHYELPEGRGSIVRLSARGLGRAGALRLLADGGEIYRSSDSARAWQTVVATVPAGSRSLEVRLEPRGGPVAVREVEVDRPLPQLGPIRLSGRTLGGFFSFVAPSIGPRRLRFRAAGLDTASDLVVRVDDAEVAVLGVEGGLRFVDADIRLGAPLLQPGRTQWIAIERRTGRGEWQLSGVSIDDLATAPTAPRLANRGDGPQPSLAPQGPPGATPLLAAASVAAQLPGREARPVGETDLFFGVPILEVAPGQAPAVAKASWAAPIVEAPPAVTGPVPSHASLLGLATGLPAPGQASSDATPLVMAPATPELMVAPAPARGRVELATTPPGAAVFAAGSGVFRGTFLGFTPLALDELAAGPAVLRLALPGYLEATITTRLPSAGRVRIDRALLPFRGLDLSRPIPLGSDPGLVVKEGYAAPAPIDLDQDGRMDLVLGVSSGALRWLRDISEMGSPLYAEPLPVVTRVGRPIGVDGYAVPTTVDWDGDARTDLVVGTRSGHVRWFRRDPLAQSVAFEDRGWLAADGTALDVGRDAKPMVVDWNGDSVPDLVVGSGHGILVLYQGTGGGALTQVGSLLTGDHPIDYELEVAPIDFSDWTGDGVGDLLVGDLYGNIWLHAGEPGRTGSPRLAARRRVTHRGGLDLVIGTYPAGFAFDLDADGYRDLFLGNSAGELMWVRGGETGDFDELLPVFEAPAATRGGVRP